MTCPLIGLFLLRETQGVGAREASAWHSARLKKSGEPGESIFGKFMDHFSVCLEHYVDHAAQLMGLSIAPDYRPGVIENMETLMAIAQMIHEFPLAPDVEAAPVFMPMPQLSFQSRSDI
jgi:hypothetical protein